MHLQVSPNAFGAEQAKGLEQFGQGAASAGDQFGQIQADDVSNQYEDAARKIVYGDPDKTITNPDGTTGPDQGYIGLKGAEALRQRVDYEKRLNETLKDARSKLGSPKQIEQFDQMSNRYRNILSGDMGRHADQQGQTYAEQTQESSIKTHTANAALYADNDELFKHAAANVIDDYRKLAQVKYGAKPGDAIWTAYEHKGMQAAAATRIETIAVTDPVRARAMADQMRGDLGDQYDNIVSKVDPKAQQQIGAQIGRGLYTGTHPITGDTGDSQNVIRGFEGFSPHPYRDNDGQLRAGYGSDTITHADGTVERVTAQTYVTKEDADRDLARRTTQSQTQVRDSIGQEAFDKLSPQTKASLTSIAYNYGSMAKPELRGLVDAAKSGDVDKIKSEVLALSSHNNGINSGRRASEAGNISTGAPPAPGAPAVPPVTLEQRKSQALTQAINDPYLQQHPNAQSAAIQQINEHFEAEHLQRTNNAVLFNKRVKDVTAEAALSGDVKNPISHQEFITNLGPERGEQAYTEYTENVQFGADKKALSTMTPVELMNTINNLPMPQPGAGYAVAAQKRQALIEEAQKIIHKDTPAFVQRIKDTTAEATSRGTIEKPISKDEFAAHFGADKGNEMYEEYTDAVKFGAEHKAVGQMTAEEVEQQKKAPLPEPGPGYATAVKRKAILESAAKAVDEERKKDMGKAIIDQMPSVKQAFEGMTVKMDPSLQPAAGQRFAATSLHEQERIGVPPEARRILPASMAEFLSNRLMQSQEPKRDMNQLAASWGQYWPQVFKDMVTQGKLSPMMQATASLPDMDAAQLTSWINGTTKGAAEGKTTRSEVGRALAVKQLGAHAVTGDTGMDEAVRSGMADMVKSWKMSGAPQIWIDGMLNSVHQLSYAKATSGDGSPAENALKAFKDRYEAMPGGAMVPKEAFPSVSENAGLALEKLKPGDLAVPPIYGKPGQAKPEEYVGLIQANPQWITSPHGDALWLMDNGGRLVRTKEGKTFELRFDAPAPPKTPDQVRMTQPWAAVRE